MPYCMNCGQKISNEAKFCSSCGTPIAESVSDTRRKTVFEGELHKCPNCGELLNSFASNCPACGNEIRGTKPSEIIHEFSLRLENVDSQEQTIALIRNFPIPNTKEDIFEFMILASTNISGQTSKVLFEAWFVKFEQCYQKAKLLFEKDNDFVKINNIYEETNKKINKERVAYNVSDVKKGIAKITDTFPNPIFGIVVVLLGIYEIIRIFKGDFIGMDIIMVALILWATYKITNKNK